MRGLVKNAIPPAPHVAFHDSERGWLICLRAAPRSKSLDGGAERAAARLAPPEPVNTHARSLALAALILC